MPTNTLKWTPLTPVQPVTFFDPSNIGNSFTPQLNPQQQQYTTGDVRKYTQTVNGTSVIIGKREYPPSEIALSWPQMDFTDYQGIAAFTVISPLVFIDNNNNGYLGVLAVQKAGQIVGMTSNVWGADFSFLVLGPYNGQNTFISQVTPPPLTVVQGAAGSGFIPNNTTIYFWLTAQTKWGESTVGNVLIVTTTADNVSLSINWAEPTSNYYLYSRLYWNTTNNSATATFLTEVQKGFAVLGQDSFVVYAPYASYSIQVPPTYGTSFAGYFAGGLWTPDFAVINLSPPPAVSSTWPYVSYTLSHTGTKSFVVTETGYVGAFTAVSDDTSIATITGTSPNFTIHGQAIGKCTLTVTDASGVTMSTVIHCT